MNVHVDEICDLAAAVWENVLGLELVQRPRAECGADRLVGSVRIRGAWDGVVAVHCSELLAKRAASLMFEVDDVSRADVFDVLGELANQVGGNIKSMLPGPSVLSLPRVGDIAMAEPRAEPDVALVREVWFDCAGELIVVRIIATPPGYVTMPPAHSAHSSPTGKDSTCTS